MSFQNVKVGVMVLIAPISVIVPVWRRVMSQLVYVHLQTVKSAGLE